MPKNTKTARHISVLLSPEIELELSTVIPTGFRGRVIRKLVLLYLEQAERTSPTQAMVDLLDDNLILKEGDLS